MRMLAPSNMGFPPHWIVFCSLPVVSTVQEVKGNLLNVTVFFCQGRYLYPTLMIKMKTKLAFGDAGNKKLSLFSVLKATYYTCKFGMYI